MPYNMQTGLQSNSTAHTAIAFRQEIRFPEADWLRLELSGVELNLGDTIRLVSPRDGMTQEITRRDPQYGGVITSVIFPGDRVTVELHLAPGSDNSRLTVGTLLIARSITPQTVCGLVDDRAHMADPCAVRIVDANGAWGSGFMVSPNWMVTAAHVMTDGPWTVQANVAPSTPMGTIQPPVAVDDQFTVSLPFTGALGVPGAVGNDWALIRVPDNAHRSPGRDCRPQFNCTYTNASPGTALHVDGFGVDLSPPEDNGVLQRGSGPSVAGGRNASHFVYQIDTTNYGSGSRVTDSDAGIVGIHTNGGCLGANPEIDANSGTLITNLTLQRGMQTFYGECPCGKCAPPRFQCYRVRRRRFRGPAVDLADRFGTAAGVLVKRPEWLCAPADKDDEEPEAPADPQHLTAYRIRHPHSATLNQVVVNEFGTISVDITRPDGLMAPTAKTLAGIGSPLTTTVLDRFKCYRIRRARRTPRFMPIPGIKVDDQFGTAILTLAKPVRLCTPVNTDAQQPGAETHPNQLLCYRALRAPSAPVTAVLNNQFGAHTVTLTKRTEFCVPAVVPPRSVVPPA